MMTTELLTAYGIAGGVVALTILTAVKIVRGAGAAEPEPRRSARDVRVAWAPVMSGRR